MAFVTGTANSMADLLAALQSACTANGWTLTGNVLSKGACYVAAGVASGYLTVQGGTGVDATPALTGAAPALSRIGPAWTGDTFTFPATYVIHIGSAPDEVYLGVNYEVSRWQWAAFGSSPVAGLPGTGNWCWASVLASISNGNNYMASGGTGGGNSLVQVMAAFYMIANNNWCNAFVHHGLDGGSWSTNNNISPANASSATGTLIGRQPNLWNGEALLVPIQPAVARTNGKASIVAQLGHARYLRNDNLQDGEIITLGADRWKAYPWHRKNASARDGGVEITHSGTFGWALRYDGP